MSSARCTWKPVRGEHPLTSCHKSGVIAFHRWEGLALPQSVTLCLSSGDRDPHLSVSLQTSVLVNATSGFSVHLFSTTSWAARHASFLSDLDLPLACRGLVTARATSKLAVLLPHLTHDCITQQIQPTTWRSESLHRWKEE